MCSSIKLREVRFAVFELRNTYAEEDYVGASHGVCRVSRKREHPSGAAAQNQLMKVRLINREMAFCQQSDSFCIVIDTENVMADGCQATACDQSSVSATDYTNLHKFKLRRWA